MEVLLKIILFFFILSFLGRLFFRYVLPWWLKRYVKKKQQQFNQQFYNGEEQSNSEGETSINKDPEDAKVNPEVGEYIDFEEIDDNNDNNKL